jgi:hypothetical protein
MKDPSFTPIQNHMQNNMKAAAGNFELKTVVLHAGIINEVYSTT